MTTRASTRLMPLPSLPWGEISLGLIILYLLT